MNSSISSFKTELKVVAVVVLVLLGIEILMRCAEGRLSIDIAHIRSGEEISERVGASSESLLLLGNSLTREGVDPEMLASAAGEGLMIESYYPDGSSVNEWAYAFRKYFAEPGNAPDFMIIGFGRSHIFDNDLFPDRFGAYFCSSRDVSRYFKRHVKNPDDAASFFLGRYSVAYTNRKRVQPRIFTDLIPHYQEVLPELKTRPRPQVEKPEPEPQHHNLTELLEAAAEAGTRVAMIAIPMPKPYPLPNATVQAIADAGAILVDARDLDGIEGARFPDDYHLDKAGARIVTEYINKTIQPLWWPENTNGN